MIQNAEYFLQGNSGLEDSPPVAGKRIGVLLIHGLTGTPNEMRMVAKGLNRAGFTVYGMQLPGHCGTEEDLLKTRWQDWLAGVHKSAEHLASQVDHFFVAGLSMGALLALKLAADRPELVAGVGVYGPTFRYDGWSIPFYARWLNFLLPWLKRFNIWQDRSFNEQPPYGLKDERLREIVSSSMLSGDSASAGLAGNPYPALAEMMHLSALVRRELPRVTSPCLIMHASNDDVANVSNSILVQKKVSGPSKLILLHDSYHLITIDRERREVIKQTVDFINGIVAKQLQRAGA